LVSEFRPSLPVKQAERGIAHPRLPEKWNYFQGAA
jgi:hypothetical protein